MRALLLLATLVPLGLSLGACGESRDRTTPTVDGGPDTTGSAPHADAVQFCIDRETWSCQRRWARDELGDAERDACLAVIDDACAGATWGADCAPSREKTDACIAALSDPELLSTPEEELTACQRETLCGSG